MKKRLQKKPIKKKNHLSNLLIRPAIFLDRDGTINHDKGYTYKFNKLMFRPHVISGLRYLSKKKYLIFIVTNQAGIAKGKFKVSDLTKLHIRMKNYLRKKEIIIHDIEYCPYHPNAVIKKYKKRSGYRKPGNLMIKKILNKWPVNLYKSFMIGDSLSDKLAAKKSKLYFEYVGNNFFDQARKIVSRKL